MNEEPTYTLAEAARALRLRDCAMYGHDWTTGPIAMCETQPRFIVCERCGKTAAVEPAEDVEVTWAGGAFIVSDDPAQAGLVDDESRLTSKGAEALNAARRPGQGPGGD